jgi:hypothetical protein
MVSQHPDGNMVVKPGDLAATIPGQATTKVFDRKRMRVLWTDGDGDGDSNKDFVTRPKTTVRGHPTWKIYMGNVPRILRGRSEPPKYVYLDDRACYAIYSSRAYGVKDLSAFWPYDFDYMGYIRASRPNRGRPAYSDRTCSVFAKGPLRGSKTEEYEFCGCPETPGQRKNDWRAKKAAKQSQAKSIEASTQISLSGAIPVTFKPGENSIANHYVSGPTDGSLKPLGIANTAMQGSPCLNIPSATVQKRPRPIPGDMAGVYAGFTAKRKAEAAFPTSSPVSTGMPAVSVAPEQKKIKIEQPDDDLEELTAVAEKLDESG